MAEEAENFGAQVRRRRKALRLTQRGLAAKLPGKTEGKDISRYETGRHLPSENTRIALAAALGCTVADLYAEPVDDEPAATPDPFATESTAAGDDPVELLHRVLDQQAELLARIDEVRDEQERQRRLQGPGEQSAEGSRD